MPTEIFLYLDKNIYPSNKTKNFIWGMFCYQFHFIKKGLYYPINQNMEVYQFFQFEKRPSIVIHITVHIKVYYI